jgi:high potential iron-sulfur protein
MPKTETRADRPLSRRETVKVLAMGTVALAGLGTTRSPAADSAPRLDVRDPAAMKLGYVENASQIDPKKVPQFQAGSSCENCMQLQGKPGNNYRPCSLFPGKLVSVSGWCSGWAVEM